MLPQSQGAPRRTRRFEPHARFFFLGGHCSADLWVTGKRRSGTIKQRHFPGTSLLVGGAGDPQPACSPRLGNGRRQNAVRQPFPPASLKRSAPKSKGLSRPSRCQKKQRNYLAPPLTPEVDDPKSTRCSASSFGCIQTRDVPEQRRPAALALCDACWDIHLRYGAKEFVPFVRLLSPA